MIQILVDKNAIINKVSEIDQNAQETIGFLIDEVTSFLIFHSRIMVSPTFKKFSKMNLIGITKNMISVVLNQRSLTHIPNFD